MQGVLRAGRALRKGSQAANVVRRSSGPLGCAPQPPELSSQGEGLIGTCHGSQTASVSAFEALRFLSLRTPDSTSQSSDCSALRTLLRGTNDSPSFARAGALTHNGAQALGASSHPVSSSSNASCRQPASCTPETVARLFPTSAGRSAIADRVQEGIPPSFATRAHHTRPLTSYRLHSPLNFHNSTLTPPPLRTPLALPSTLSLQRSPHTRLQHTQEHQQAPKQPRGSGRDRSGRGEGEAGQESRLVAEQEDVFDSITDKIPERPVTVAEGASYSVVILLGLAVALGAAYFAAKELLFEPKEYKVFNRALARVQRDAQVISYLGSPITGYGQDSRNRAARQRISHKVWKDEEGVEKTMVQFHVRGPGGAGLVHCEMFQDPGAKGKLQFTYLVVDITTPVPRRLMLESYVPE